MEGSVYLKARQEWDGRYADLVLGKRNWQIIAGGVMVITLVLAFGMVRVNTRSKFVPYAVEVDKLGYALGAPSAPASGGRTAQHHRIHLARNKLSVTQVCQQFAVFDDRLAAQDRRHRPSFDLPSLPRAVVADVEVLAG